MKRAHVTAAAIPAAWVAALVLPSLVWVLSDRSLWPWDPAYYGAGTLALHDAASPAEWWRAMTHALQLMPPLLVWIGQLFVPLRAVTGDLESALLLQNIALAGVTLVLVYKLTRDMFDKAGGGGVTAALAATAVCGGAGLFIGLTHAYLTETLQAATAAFSMTVALHAEQRSRLRNVALVLLLIAAAMLAKVSSILFVAPALAYVAVAQMVREPKQDTRGDRVLLAMAIAATVLALAWYETNARYVMRHAVAASIGGEALAQRQPEPFFTQLGFWIGALADSISATRIVAAILALIVVTALVTTALRLARGSNHRERLRAAITTRTLFGAYLAATIVGTLVVYPLQTNEEQRYLAPVLPLAAGLIGWSLAQLRRLPLTLVVLAMGAANAAIFHAEAFGHRWEFMTPSAWLGAPDRSGAARAALVKALANTCNRSGPHLVAVADDAAALNENTASFIATQAGIACIYRKPPDGEDAKAWIGTVGVEDAIALQSAAGVGKVLAGDARFDHEQVGPYIVFHRPDFSPDDAYPSDFQQPAGPR